MLLQSVQRCLLQVHYDLLVGADGVNSVVRLQLADRMPEGFVKQMKHKAVYTTAGVSLPAEDLPGHGFMQMHFFPVRLSSSFCMQKSASHAACRQIVLVFEAT